MIEFDHVGFGYTNELILKVEGSYHGLKTSCASLPRAGVTTMQAVRLDPDGDFTFSRSLDWTSFLSDLDTINVINPFNARAYRGVSDFNVPHRFVLNYVWQMPAPAHDHSMRCCQRRSRPSPRYSCGVSGCQTKSKPWRVV